MTADLALVASGLVLLVLAGDALVQGAVALSLKLGVSALVVSLTVVAFGTSAPELLVSIEATLKGSTGLVFGNVVGSNIANILLVLGAPALIAPVTVGQRGLKRNFSMMIVASALFILACAYGGLSFWIGIGFLAALAAILFYTYRMATRGEAEVELDAPEDGMSNLKIGGYILAGLIGLPIGAHLLIEGARAIAFGFGVSEAAIGLTLVAIGTSLPELATTVMAAVRRQAGVAVGNVVGSNMFNILGVAGVAALVGDLPTPPGFLELDLWIMLGSALLIAPFLFMKKSMGRMVGVAFLAAYVIYIVFALGPRM